MPRIPVSNIRMMERFILAPFCESVHGVQLAHVWEGVGTQQVGEAAIHVGVQLAHVWEGVGTRCGDGVPREVGVQPTCVWEGVFDSPTDH